MAADSLNQHPEKRFGLRSDAGFACFASFGAAERRKKRSGYNFIEMSACRAVVKTNPGARVPLEN